MNDEIALYFHIPFCRRRCGYCSFTSYENREREIQAYVEALTKELSWRSDSQRVTSVYIGGGTPSLLSIQQLSMIIDHIRSRFVVTEAEITMEVNPGTVDESYLSAVNRLGINRLSFGVQSLSDKELQFLGRIHTAAQALEAYNLARKVGFTNINLDIIYGLPIQTIRSWQNTLEGITYLAPEHLSLYPLTLSSDAPMQQMINRGEISPLDPDFAADQYEMAQNLLADFGYGHYEISNWAREGYECRHNLIYWHNLSYMGIGAAAHSWLGGRRFSNTPSLDAYLMALKENRLPALDIDEKISMDMELAETMILQLRLAEGLSLEDIKSRFGTTSLMRHNQQIDDLVQLGLLEHSDKRVCLTRRGRLLGNEVFWRLLPEE